MLSFKYKHAKMTQRPHHRQNKNFWLILPTPPNSNWFYFLLNNPYFKIYFYNKALEMVERDLEFWQIDTEQNFWAENLLNWLENKY